MGLTVGRGPFGKSPTGQFNFAHERPDGVLYFEDSPRRVRVTFNGEVVADTQRAKLLHETGHLPVYYFPEPDVRTELLRVSSHRTHCPLKGDASYWTIEVGERTAVDAVWSYPQVIDGAPPLAGYYAFHWKAMDAWFEEDEEIIGHPRDPYHRVDVRRSTCHVVVRVDGQVLADTHRPLLLFETGLPVRYYLPREDVRGERLVSSCKRTICPYKGYASYWSVRAEQREIKDLMWCYEEPLDEVAKIASYVCVPQESPEVEMEVEGR